MLNYQFFALLFCVFMPTIAYTQAYNYETINQTTKDFFVEKKWTELLTESHEAIKAGTDFYDLRLRRGLAYLNMKKYRRALAEFEATQKFFPADTVGKYYLCAMHDALGNIPQAQQKANSLPAKHRTELAYKKQNLLEIGIFGSYTNFNAENKINNIVQKETGEWNAYRGLVGGGVYVSHLVGKKLAITHTASGFAFQNFKKINYPNQKAIFYNDGVQIGGGTSAELYLPKQWKIKASLQYNHIGAYTQTFNTTKNIYEVNEFLQGGFLAGGSVKKGYKNLDFLFGTYWNNFLQYYTLQETAGLSYYPFSNARFAVIAHISFLQNLAETNAGYQNARLFLIKTNVQAYKSIWLSASYLKGDTQNFYDIENNAIYYTTDRTRQQFQVSAYFLLNKHLRLNVSYTHLTRESNQFIAYNANATVKPITYNANQFTTLLAWRF